MPSNLTKPKTRARRHYLTMERRNSKRIEKLRANQRTARRIASKQRSGEMEMYDA